MTSWHFKRKQIGKETLIIAQKIPSRQREWNSMKNLALLAVFTMASIASSSMLALSEPNSTFAEMEKENCEMVMTLREALNKYSI